MKHFLEFFYEHIQAHKTPIIIALIGSICHIAFTKGTFKDAVLKFISAFIGAIILAPGITEYFNLSLKMNNIIVLVLTFGTYYLIKGLIKTATEFSENPKNYIFDLINKWKGTKSNDEVPPTEEYNENEQ